MESKRRIKPAVKHLVIGVIVPAFLMVNAFLVPEPYSHPLLNVAITPTKLMPFLENRELMRELTLFVFGRMTPNYAPITIVFLVFFWFLVGVIASLLFSYIGERRRQV